MKKSTCCIALLILCSNTILFSQWQKISSYPAAQAQDIIFSGNTVYVISNGGGVYKSVDGTASWQQFNNGLANADALRDNNIMFSGSNIYLATVDGVYKSTNGGTNWVRKSIGLIIGGGSNNLFAESIFENSGVLYTGTYSGIYRSTNGGENWIVTNISGSGVMATEFLNYNGILYAARESINIPGSYKSTDNGLTWAPFSISGAYLPAITFFNDNTRLYAGTIDGVWLSTNNGLNWSSRNQGLSADPYSSSIIRVNGVLFTSLKFGGSGIYRSFNDGQQWENISTGLPFLNEITRLIVYQDKIISATSDGLYQRPVSELTPVLSNSETVWEFSLYQNYPNPFNPSTFIKYSILKEGNVKLKVFDVTGREVSSLVNENQKPGSYEITFDASSLPSGIYFYKIETGKFVSTRKMLLIK